MENSDGKSVFALLDFQTDAQFYFPACDRDGALPLDRCRCPGYAKIGADYLYPSRQHYPYGSDGSTAERHGDTTYGSNGETYETHGDKTYGSDGSTAEKIGNKTFIEKPDGTTATCEKVGDQTFCADD